MKIIAFLEKNKIASRETLPILIFSIVLLELSRFLMFIHMTWLSFGCLLIVAGGILNYIVMDSNNLCMPVLAKSKHEYFRFIKNNPGRRICKLNKKTRFAILCDRFNIRGDMFSIGDFIIDIGMFVMLIATSSTVVNFFSEHRI